VSTGGKGGTVAFSLGTSGRGGEKEEGGRGVVFYFSLTLGGEEDEGDVWVSGCGWPGQRKGRALSWYSREGRGSGEWAFMQLSEKEMVLMRRGGLKKGGLLH